MSEEKNEKIGVDWHEHQSFSRQCFEENVSGIYISNIDGYLITCNDAFAKIFGISSGFEATGTSLSSFFPDSLTMEEFIQLIIKKKKVIGHKSTMCGPDGYKKTVMQNVIGIFDESGKLVEIRGFLVDFSSQKNLERQVIQAQKMEAIGTLASGIAHDFNNLLMTIQGNVSLMMMDADESHPFNKQLGAIEKKVFDGAKLTSQLLGYARKKGFEEKQVNLNRLIQETSEAFGRMRKEITIKTDLANDQYRIKADRTQMEQVLLNLYINSADAMPYGGKLLIKTDTVSHECWASSQYVPKPGTYVRVRIADTGIGMNMETQSRIFDPFFSTKDKMVQGKGLGLLVTYRIIKGHGGYIEVKSECNKGTVFSIYLPKSEVQEKHMIKTDKVIKSKNGNEKILLVDDDKMVLDVGGRVLEKLNYGVYNAAGGTEAVEIMKQQNGEIEIVILDMILPEMSSEETYDQLKEIDPEVKILLSSGYDLNGQAQEMMERGCDGFIQKPFRVKEISQKISEILSKN